MSRVRRLSSERSWVRNPSGAVSNVGQVYHRCLKSLGMLLVCPKKDRSTS